MATKPEKSSDKKVSKPAAKAAAKTPRCACRKKSAQPTDEKSSTEASPAAVPQPAKTKTPTTLGKENKKPVSPKPANASTGSTRKKPAATKAKPDTQPETRDAEPAAKDTLTPEERERSRKLKATLELLKADPEWPAFLEEQREALYKLRDDLAPNVHNVTREHLRSGASNLSSSSGQHIGDAGSDAEVRALTISLLDKDREQLFEIDAALERIRRGTYGICEISLEPIPKGRLRARPFCRLTVKCQEEYEKKYGSYANYRAKNQGSVGFAGLQNDEDDAISLDDSEE